MRCCGCGEAFCLSQEGDVGGDGVLVVLELVAEAGGEEFVFDVDTDLGAGEEDEDCGKE